MTDSQYIERIGLGISQIKIWGSNSTKKKKKVLEQPGLALGIKKTHMNKNKFFSKCQAKLEMD